MRFATFNQIPLRDLTEMANGKLEDTLTDLDFFETLADQHCFVAAPWIMQASSGGDLRKVTRLTYTFDGQLDKSRLLVVVARQLGLTQISRFNPRFSV